MSEERRKRQQERKSEPKGNKGTVITVVVLILLAAAYLTGRYYRNHKYDSFAKCLASRQAKMYGLYWCPHCADQKAMFGSSFHYVPYVECANPDDPHQEAAACKAAGVKLFPSWQFGNEPPKEGVQPLEALSQKTGCSLP